MKPYFRFDCDRIQRICSDACIYAYILGKGLACLWIMSQHTTPQFIGNLTFGVLLWSQYDAIKLNRETEG